jgi:Domain of unknown function (DUF4129)
MNRHRMKPLLWCLALSMVTAGAEAQENPAELAADLRQIEAGLDSKGAAVLAGLPAAWAVVTPERQYVISTEPLRSLLVSPRSDRIQASKEWLDQVAQQLEAFSKTPAQGVPNTRGRLDQILARPEFAGVRPPTAWDLFRQRVILWLASLVQRFFTFAAQHPTGGKILFWVLLVGAVGVLAAWLFRVWTRRDPAFRLPPPNPAGQARSWEAWVRAAREAANRGDAREAIHCAYWAGIWRLQERHVLPEDLTRTPREYLRLVPAPETAAAAPLTALTAGLERFWYAGQAAHSDDFEASLKQLEALGCKLD